MKKELDEELCSNFPSLYRDRSAPMTASCMYWGFSCGDGWYNLIYTLSEFIETSLRSERHETSCKWYMPRQLYRPGKKLSLPYEWVFNTAKKNVGVVMVVDQVKEKFGGLRFYYHFESNPDAVDVDQEYTKEICKEIQGAVDFAESLSFKICEECGNPGKVRGGGWVRTLCATDCEKLSYPLDTPEEV